MSKHTVKITSAPEARVVSFIVMKTVTDFYKGRRVGSRIVKVGEGTVIGRNGNYAHLNMAGWSFVAESATEAGILSALTDKTNDFYLR